MDRSGREQDALVLGNVLIVDGYMSREALFERNGRLQLDEATWGAMPPTRAISVLGKILVDRIRAPRADELPAPASHVSLFPSVTRGTVLNWSLHSGDGTPIFTLSAPIQTGHGYYVAGTYDAAEGFARLYLSGEQVAEARASAGLGVYAGATGAVTMNPPGHDSTWRLDDLTVWGRALSGAEIRSVMANGPVVDTVTAVDEGDAVTVWGALKAR